MARILVELDFKMKKSEADEFFEIEEEDFERSRVDPDTEFGLGSRTWFLDGLESSEKKKLINTLKRVSPKWFRRGKKFYESYKEDW